MRKLFAIIAVLAVAVTLSACEKKQTVGQQVDGAIADTQKAINDATK